MFKLLPLLCSFTHTSPLSMLIGFSVARSLLNGVSKVCYNFIVAIIYYEHNDNFLHVFNITIVIDKGMQMQKCNEHGIQNWTYQWIVNYEHEDHSLESQIDLKRSREV